MKRTILSVAGAMLLGAAVTAFVFVNNRSEEDFFNDNIAALASGETENEACIEAKEGHCWYYDKGKNYTIERHINRQ